MDERGPDELFDPARRLRRRRAVSNPCVRCGGPARWRMRGKVRRPEDFGQPVPSPEQAPWGAWALLCSGCLEPVKATLGLAELLELQVEPLEPLGRGRMIGVPSGLG